MDAFSLFIFLQMPPFCADECNQYFDIYVLAQATGVKAVLLGESCHLCAPRADLGPSR